MRLRWFPLYKARSAVPRIATQFWVSARKFLGCALRSIKIVEVQQTAKAVRQLMTFQPHCCTAATFGAVIWN
jgi:hypothetical protein